MPKVGVVVAVAIAFAGAPSRSARVSGRSCDEPVAAFRRQRLLHSERQRVLARLRRWNSHTRRRRGLVRRCVKTSVEPPHRRRGREPNGKGYWLVAQDGGVFTFGDAHFYGSMAATQLKQPVFSMAPTKSGHGYWLVARDGGVFTFGDAKFYGSTGSLVLNEPITGMTASRTGTGYRMVAADGGIFAFGDVPFYGSLPGLGITANNVVGMARISSDLGYWIARSTGEVYALGLTPADGGSTCNTIAAIFSYPTARGDGYRLVTDSGATIPFGSRSGRRPPDREPKVLPELSEHLARRVRQHPIRRLVPAGRQPGWLRRKPPRSLEPPRRHQDLHVGRRKRHSSECQLPERHNHVPQQPRGREDGDRPHVTVSLLGNVVTYGAACPGRRSCLILVMRILLRHSTGCAGSSVLPR